MSCYEKRDLEAVTTNWAVLGNGILIRRVKVKQVFYAAASSAPTVTLLLLAYNQTATIPHDPLPQHLQLEPEALGLIPSDYCNSSNSHRPGIVTALE